MSTFRKPQMFTFKLNWTQQTYDGETGQDIGPEPATRTVHVVAESEAVARAHLDVKDGCTCELVGNVIIDAIINSQKFTH